MCIKNNFKKKKKNNVPFSKAEHSNHQFQHEEAREYQPNDGEYLLSNPPTDGYVRTMFR